MAKSATKTAKKPKTSAKSTEKVEVSTENNPFLCSISALSRKFKLDRATVRERLENAEIQPHSTKAKEKLYHLEDVEIVLSQSELNEAKLRKLDAEAELKELEVKKKLGEYGSVAEFTEVVQKIFGRMYKEAVVNIPKQIARDVHEANSSAEVQEKIQKRYSKLFDDLRINFKSYL